MKTTMKTSFFALLIATTTGISAQVNMNEVESTEIKTVELNEKEAFTVKTVTEEVKALRFERADIGKEEKNLRPTPILVTKTIWIDNDKDDLFDKKIRMFYSKDDNAKLNYIATEDGVLVKDGKGISKLVSEEGIYQLNSDDTESVIISFDNLEASK